MGRKKGLMGEQTASLAPVIVVCWKAGGFGMVVSGMGESLTDEDCLDAFVSSS